jgi:hypothetical protein
MAVHTTKLRQFVFACHVRVRQVSGKLARTLPEMFVTPIQQFSHLDF